MRHDFNRQTPFEELRVVEVVHLGLLRRDDRGVKADVLVLGERAVQVIAGRIVDDGDIISDTVSCRFRWTGLGLQALSPPVESPDVRP